MSYYKRDSLDYMLWGLYAMVGLVVLVLALALIELLWLNETKSYQGTVVSKQYTPSQSSVGIAFSGSGKPVIVSSYEGEKYTVIVNVQGQIVAASITSSQWAIAEPKMPITLYISTGSITGFGVSTYANLQEK